MDINNNQQVNTFVKGMNTDVSDALMDSSQYRYAENVRLVTNTDSNSGEIRVVEGTKEFTDYFRTIGIKTMCSIRNLLVVVGDNDCIYSLYHTQFRLLLSLHTISSVHRLLYIILLTKGFHI